MSIFIFIRFVPSPREAKKKEGLWAGQTPWVRPSAVDLIPQQIWFWVEVDSRKRHMQAES